MFKTAQGAVRKTRTAAHPNETVLLKIPASLYRHDNTKDRINQYARENLTTPLRIVTRAETWLLANRYEVGGRMTVTTRRLIFEPTVFKLGEPSEEILLDDLVEAVDTAFWGTSYKDRYEILCRRLVRERLYDAACFVTASEDPSSPMTEPAADLSFSRFAAEIRGRAKALLEIENA